ncbi:MAG TPA: energy transducer TonB [Terriglobales bacterium]|nr:energy transducer TonB [Terriglobales bacterium]
MNNSRVRSLLVAAALIMAFCLSASVPSSAQDETGRKAVKQEAPLYPELAHRLNITGTVKLELEIARDGKVTNAKALGGNPVLIDSAMRAAKQWVYAPAQQETTQIVAIKFSPGQ